MLPSGNASRQMSPVRVRVSVALSDQVESVPEPSSQVWRVPGSEPSRVCTKPRVVPARGRPVVVPVNPTPGLVDVQMPAPDCSTAGRALTDAAVAVVAADITGSAAETTGALMIMARFIGALVGLVGDRTVPGGSWCRLVVRLGSAWRCVG